MIRRSDEFRTYFSSAVSAKVDGKEAAVVRVRVTFLQDVISSATAAGQFLNTSVSDACSSLPVTTRQSLLNMTATLFSNLELLKTSLQGSEVTASAQVHPHALRSLLLRVQESRQSLSLDPSLSVRAATKAEASTAIDWEATDPVPHLGIGRTPALRTLLDVLPIEQLLHHINIHVADLPSCPVESPIALFAQQTLHLGWAVLFCGLESALPLQRYL